MENSFSPLLRQWRVQRRLSLGALAQKSGVHAATLSRWETGRNYPRSTEVGAVLNALMVSRSEREEALRLLATPRTVRLLEHPTGQLPPLSGDLLRAMRLRKGLTQLQVAQPLGITQGMLAKWERSEDWPSAERISALCHLLDAREEELTALLSNQFVSEPVQEDVEWEEMEGRIGALLFTSPLADLEFLALEERLWRQTARSASNQHLLDITYAGHARYLTERRRFMEAKIYLTRVQELHYDNEYQSIGLNHLMAQAAVEGQGGAKPHPLKGYEELNRSVHTVRNDAFKAWMQSEMAHYLLLLQESDIALRLSQEALQTAKRCSQPFEIWFRLLDHAALLNQLGRYEEAFASVERITQIPDFQPVGLAIALRLAGTRALFHLNRCDEAMQGLMFVHQKLKTTPAHLYRETLRDQAALLARQLDAPSLFSD